MGDGPITVPPHTRIVVENYDHDDILDTRIGIEEFAAYTVPLDQKAHVLVRSDIRGPLTRLDATHLSPNSILAPNDAIRFYGISVPAMPCKAVLSPVVTATPTCATWAGGVMDGPSVPRSSATTRSTPARRLLRSTHTDCAANASRPTTHGRRGARRRGPDEYRAVREGGLEPPRP